MNDEVPTGNGQAEGAAPGGEKVKKIRVPSPLTRAKRLRRCMAEMNEEADLLRNEGWTVSFALDPGTGSGVVGVSIERTERRVEL